MTLEELRERFRTPWLSGLVSVHDIRRKKGGKGVRRAQTAESGFELAVYFCRKCKEAFEPDPELGYVPSVCAKCDYYL